MNKKAFLYNLAVAFALLAALTFAAVTLDAKREKIIDQELGAKQAMLFQAYQQGEIGMLYVDQAAKLSVCGAAIGAANDFGSEMESKQAVMSEQDARLFAIEKFSSAMSKNLDSYLVNPQPPTRGLFPPQNYELVVESDSTVRGFAFNPITFMIYSEKIEYSLWGGLIKRTLEPGAVGIYAVRPSFSVNANYDFDAYPQIAARLAELNAIAQEWRDFPAVIPLKLSDKIAEFNQNQQTFAWELSAAAENSTYLFKITHNAAIPLCSQKPVIQFKIKMPFAQAVSA